MRAVWGAKAPKRRQSYSFSAPAKVELFMQRLKVVAHRGLEDPKALSYLLVCETPAQKLEHLHLPWGQQSHGLSLLCSRVVVEAAGQHGLYRLSYLLGRAAWPEISGIIRLAGGILNLKPSQRYE
jgi:hypothetical protein